MNEIVVLVPVLNRPQNVKPLLESLRANSVSKPAVLFVCSPGDDDSRHAITSCAAPYTVVAWSADRADWAKKLEHGRGLTVQPLMLLAADDLRFHPGWDTALIDAWRRHDIGVMGTNDMGNPQVKRGLHSTHPCVRREYADCFGTVDDGELMLHQGYDHQFCDNELVETAMSRGCWYFCAASRVEHLHPSWKKAPLDSTYAKAFRDGKRDARLFRRRRALWRRSRAGQLTQAW